MGYADGLVLFPDGQGGMEQVQPGCLPVRRSDARPFYLDCRKAVLPSCEAESDAGEVQTMGEYRKLLGQCLFWLYVIRQFCIVLHYSRTKEPFQGATADRKVAGDTGR